MANTTIEDIILGMKNKVNGSVCLFDTEQTVVGQIVFDLAYGFIGLNSGRQKGFKSYLNLDAIANKPLMLTIASWGKIKEASEGSYYGFFNTLQRQGWFSDDFSTDQINDEMDIMYRKLTSQKLITMTKRRERESKTVNYWREKEQKGHKGSAQRLIDANVRYQSALETEGLYMELLNTEEKITSAKIQGLNEEAIRNKVIFKLYNLQYKNKKLVIPGTTEELKRQAKELLQLPNLKDWKEISTLFLKDIMKYNTMFLTSYNLANDLRFIENTNRLTGVNLMNFSDSSAISQFCSYRMYQEMRKNPEEILNLFGDKEKSFVQQALEKTGKGSQTLDVFGSIFASPSFLSKKGERHTAFYDTQLLANALVQYLNKELKIKGGV